MYFKKFTIKTQGKLDIINIDKYIFKTVKSSQVKNGIVNIYTPHTTAAITINENGDPNVLHDLKLAFRELSPNRKEYKHFEGNSDSHVLSSIIGPSENIVLLDSKLLLGTWQSIYLCDFDGPRSRNFFISIK